MNRLLTCMMLTVSMVGCFEDTEPEVDPVADAAVEPDGVCTPGETICDEQGRSRTCLEEGDGWLVEACGEGFICIDGGCIEQVCTPGARSCDGQTVLGCNADGTGTQAIMSCVMGASCVDGVCLAPICTPGEQLCGEGVSLLCADDGRTWDRSPCAEGERCIDGACAALPPPEPTCPPGEILCGETAVYACADDGSSFVETPCPPGEVCFEGACIACVRDSDCGARDRACVGGQCVEPPLRVATEELPPGQEDAPYEVGLEAVFGVPPYRWSLADGALPRGIGLNGEGIIRGTPLMTGDFPVTFRVVDDERTAATAELVLRVIGGGLQIVTDGLPEAEEGMGYEAQLEALGGVDPYGWLIVEGALPAGLALSGDGRIAGTPSEIGAFPITARVVDAGDPPQAAERELVLTVSVAPLEIVADQTLDLFFTRVITLPTLTVIGDNPLPYDTQLTARGGLRPYAWVETDLPDNLRQFVPQAGIPEGITLDDDGRLSGVVASFDQQIEVEIPFTGIVLTGFFFTAEVSDSQEDPDTDSAIFLLPTLPLGG